MIARSFPSGTEETRALARKRRRSGNADGSRKAPAGASRPTAPQGADELKAGASSKISIWIAASAAMLIVAVGGITFYLRNQGADERRPSFVGSQVCAGCHQGEAR